MRRRQGRASSASRLVAMRVTVAGRSGQLLEAQTVEMPPESGAARPAEPLTWRRPLRLVRALLADSLYRNTFLLILNYVIVGGLGFVFWAVAARLFPTDEIGNVTALFSALNFAAIAAGFGLQNTVVRYMSGEIEQRAFLVGSVVVVTTASVLLTAGVLLVPGHLGVPVVAAAGPLELACVVVITVMLAAGAIADAAIIGFRVTGRIVVKNTAAGLLRLAVFPLAIGTSELGLLICLTVPASVATVVAVVMALRLTRTPDGPLRPLRVLRSKLQFSLGNHVATLVSVGPLAVLPVFVVNQIGAAEGAYLAACLSVIIALSAVPTTISQSLFAELAADPGARLELVARVFRTLYVILVPVVLVLCAVAGPLLAVFGPDYTSAASCLRLMALAALFTGFNYVADVVLNAAGRIGAFTAVNLLGAASVLGLSLSLGTTGLTGLGLGWLLGQIGYSVCAAVALARTDLLGRGGEHREAA